MKKVIVSGFFALFSIGMFAQVDTSNLPGTARDFVNEHFSSISIEGIEENSNWKIWEDDKYEVRLSNGIELDFDEKGNLIEIDSQNKEGIPSSALPSNIASYLNSHYAGMEVIGWEKQKKVQEIELMDGTEIEFDNKGNFRKLD